MVAKATESESEPRSITLCSATPSDVQLFLLTEDLHFSVAERRAVTETSQTFETSSAFNRQTRLSGWTIVASRSFTADLRSMLNLARAEAAVAWLTHQLIRRET